MPKYKVKATLRGRRLETDISFSTKEAAEKYARETNMYNLNANARVVKSRR